MPRDPLVTASERPRSPSAPRQAAKAAGLDGLRARIRAIEHGKVTLEDGTAPLLPLGIPAIDARLGGGLAMGALHDLIAGDAGAASAFAIALAAKLMRRRDGAVLWCASPHTLEAGAFYAPGLRALGLDPARLIAVEAARHDAVLWAMEEGLHCPALAAVIGETAPAGLTETRRLQLAAATQGVTALLLRPAAEATRPSAAMTRWRVSAAPSRPGGLCALAGAPGAPCWQMELLRCRAGAPGAWCVEWRDETGDFALAAPLRDRPAAAGHAIGAVRAGA
jgi:protein ImuA